MTHDEQQAGGLQDDEPQHGAADPWAQEAWHRGTAPQIEKGKGGVRSRALLVS